ncbi:MAG: succinate--CoA ligase subunit alpha [Candidatus Eremiobacteraeota bacterium]|jgi:succinyl-CoA synthetase alpha subunit|nr:succinate--CoA ligase subunit alpha [Candidatus Eremiobacteraeota bacterium]MCL5055299.1 succinate--CoA ligase subunit alpha [Bacillota bacterium]
MGILVNKNTRVIVQGITGKEGQFHTKQMLDYGTKVVGGVTPGKGGTRVLDLPVFNSVQEAVSATQADASVIFVPPPYAADGIFESIAAGIKIIVCITEGIPVHDMMKVYRAVKENKVFLIGPNCPGITTAGEAKLGIIPGKIFKPGNIGVISRSGTLTYEVVNSLTRAGLGQSTCIGIGGDPIIGMRFKDGLQLFNQDPGTDAVILIGEIGGSDEEEAAELIPSLRVPVATFIAGRTAPPGKRMGHAGAIISGNQGTPQSKVEAFRKAGVPVSDTIPELIEKVKELVKMPV